MSLGKYISDRIKLFKSTISFDGVIYVKGGSDDPQSVAQDMPQGSLYIRDDATIFQKNDGGSSTDFTKLAKETGGSVNSAGMISPYGGTTAPAGWVMCDGKEYDGLDSTYAGLYAVIQKNFGSESGGDNFNVPDLRGRFLRGSDDMGTAEGAAGLDPEAGSRSPMHTGGNPANNVGSVQGGQFRSHGHGLQYVIPPGGVGGDQISGVAGQDPNRFPGTGAAGGTETRPVNAYVNYIIKL